MGSPFGAVVDGYDELHAIHSGMFAGQAGTSGGSRYSIEHVRRLRADVVIAFVRRTSARSGASMEPGCPDTFDELALFVLVEVGGTWWLAAGQHVPDRRDVNR